MVIISLILHFSSICFEEKSISDTAITQLSFSVFMLYLFLGFQFQNFVPLFLMLVSEKDDKCRFF